MGIILTLATLFLFIGSPEYNAEPVKIPVCTSTELGYLIQLGLSEERIHELCKENE